MRQTPETVLHTLSRIWETVDREVAHLLDLDLLLAKQDNSVVIREQRQLIVHEIDRRRAQARQKMQELLNAYRPEE